MWLSDLSARSIYLLFIVYAEHDIDISCWAFSTGTKAGQLRIVVGFRVPNNMAAQQVLDAINSTMEVNRRQITRWGKWFKYRKIASVITRQIRARAIRLYTCHTVAMMRPAAFFGVFSSTPSSDVWSTNMTTSCPPEIKFWQFDPQNFAD